MIDCVQFMFSLRRFYRYLQVNWGNTLTRISFALLIIGCSNRASAQLNSSVLSQGVWYFLETSSDDVYVLDGDHLYGDMQLSAPVSFANLGLFSSSEGPLQEENSARRAEGLQELPTYHVDENNNGLFDQEDAIVFYKKAVSINPDLMMRFDERIRLDKS